jgi:putative hemolysin
LAKLGRWRSGWPPRRTEIEAAQALRYKVFVEEMGARLPLEAMQQKRDFDTIDRYCDHLLVS